MNLLFLSPYLPSPPTFGGQRRVHGLMRALARRHRIGVLALHKREDPREEWLAATRAWCSEAETFDQPMLGLAGRSKRLVQLRGLASLESWDLRSHRNRELSGRLQQKLAAEPWDALVVEFIQMMVNVDRRRLPPGLPIVLDEHNIEFDLQRRTALAADSLARRTFQEVNWRKLQREEVAAWKWLDGISVTSERDRSLVAGAVPAGRCVLAPNGVDLESFKPPAGGAEPNTVIFFGAHNYFPNTDGLRFLLTEIWPQIIAARPSARLRVVGPRPPDEVAALAPPSVSIEGRVDDIAAAVGRASVAIAPLRIGGGTRLKVIEAMALARPIVATRIGAEGIDVEGGRDLLLADAPGDFARAVLRLLANPAEAEALGKNARKRAEESYGWDACARPLEQLLEGLVQKRRAGR